jgi:predicted DNA-binding transcriptional regulator AlpA
VEIIPDSVLAKLQAWARAGDAVSTEQARALLGLTPQQFHRRAQHGTFPRREHIGRQWFVNPQQLLEFAQGWNALARGLTLTEVGHLIHCTLATARRVTRQEGFPAPLGEFNGRERWNRDAILEWQRQRLGGAKLDGAAKSTPNKSTAKGKRNGKAKPTARA